MDARWELRRAPFTMDQHTLVAFWDECGTQWMLGQCYCLRGSNTKLTVAWQVWCGHFREGMAAECFPSPLIRLGLLRLPAPKEVASSQSIRESGPSLGSWEIQRRLRTGPSPESFWYVTEGPKRTIPSLV